ncbi:MAG: hypothetical protein ACXV2C_03220 [Candidatus Bathyarchaeia archaeon]
MQFVTQVVNVSAFQDPIDHKYIVDEMLYDECAQCFAGWSNMSWNSSTET